MPTVVDFLSKVYNAPPNVLGHFGFLVFNITNVLYLVLIQGYVFGRLQRDTLLKLALVGCLVQAISCSASISTFNEVNSISANLIAGVCGIIAHASMDIAHVFLFFRREHGKFIKFGTGCIVVVAIYYMIGLNVHLSDIANGKGASAGGMAPTDFFIASTIWQLVAVIKFRFDFSKKEIQYEDNSSRMPRETFLKLLTVIVVLEVISIAFEMSGIWVLAFAFSGFQYSLSVSIMIYVGTLDFMTGEGSLWGRADAKYHEIHEEGHLLISGIREAHKIRDAIEGKEKPKTFLGKVEDRVKTDLEIGKDVVHLAEDVIHGKEAIDRVKKAAHNRYL